MPARSERQALDWALVLASQGIEAAIEAPNGDGPWTLRVPSAERARALEAIRLYRRENRRFAWRRELPPTSLVFHNAVLIWAVGLIVLHGLQSPLLEPGRFDTAQFRQGAWWRAFTATTLHSDVAHLAANTLTGSVPLGLAMGRFGPGTALFLTLLGGAAGNLFAMTARGTPYLGLGASGVVLAAVGLLAGHAVTWWRVSRHATRHVVASVAASVFLFLVVGVDPAADVLAHLGGFLSGLLLGALAAWGRWERRDTSLGIAYAATLALSWILAVVRR